MCLAPRRSKHPGPRRGQRATREHFSLHPIEHSPARLANLYERGATGRFVGGGDGHAPFSQPGEQIVLALDPVRGDVVAVPPDELVAGVGMDAEVPVQRPAGNGLAGSKLPEAVEAEDHGKEIRGIRGCGH